LQEYFEIIGLGVNITKKDSHEYEYNNLKLERLRYSISQGFSKEKN
jgi:hypothetical protein